MTTTDCPYTCCAQPMQPIYLTEVGADPAAYLCENDLKWRHALSPEHRLRKRVVEIMGPLTKKIFDARNEPFALQHQGKNKSTHGRRG